MKLSEKVRTIKARQILTSRGLPTVEVEFKMESTSIIGSVPSGKSTGGKEACVLLDGGTDYLGLAVTKVVKKINNNAKRLLTLTLKAPEEFDKILIDADGTPDKSKSGANYILPLSICCYKLFSYCEKLDLWKYIERHTGSKCSLPIPCFNILNGGEHSGNGLSCQEIMVAFQRPTFRENLKCAVVLYQTLKELISTEYGSIYTGVADEGGFAPPFKNIEEALELVMKAAETAHLRGFQIMLDLAANSFYNKKKYTFDGLEYTGEKLGDHYCALLDKFPIAGLEDPFAEDDVASWGYLHAKCGDRIFITADDLTVTNPEIIGDLGVKGLFNSVLIKPNQVGSVSETIKAVQLVKGMGMKAMVSHRSAETEDTFVCHLAVGLGADRMKMGAPCRGERVSKYNEMLRIEEVIKGK